MWVMQKSSIWDSDENNLKYVRNHGVWFVLSVEYVVCKCWFCVKMKRNDAVLLKLERRYETAGTECRKLVGISLVVPVLYCQ